jgi:hypothetical protein
MNKTVPFSGMIACVVLVSSVVAHQPLFNPGSPSAERAFRIAEPQVSKVITAEARSGGQDWYVMDVGNSFRLDVALFVGAPCPKAFMPKLWLVGPGLDGRAPFAVPVGMGAVNVGEGWMEYSGHGVVARKSPTLIRMLNAGKYYLMVDHGESRGWYFISMGGDELPGGTSEGRAALARFNRCG